MKKLSRLLAYEYVKIAAMYSGYTCPTRVEFKKLDDVLIFNDEEMLKHIKDLEVEFTYNLEDVNEIPGGYMHDWIDNDHYSIFVYNHGHLPLEHRAAYIEATIVHEMVHLLQHMAGMDMEDVRVVETEAYNAQREYMKDFWNYENLGDDLEAFLKKEGYVS